MPIYLKSIPLTLVVGKCLLLRIETIFDLPSWVTIGDCSDNFVVFIYYTYTSFIRSFSCIIGVFVCIKSLIISSYLPNAPPE